MCPDREADRSHKHELSVVVRSSGNLWKVGLLAES